MHQFASSTLGLRTPSDRRLREDDGLRSNQYRLIVRSPPGLQRNDDRLTAEHPVDADRGLNSAVDFASPNMPDDARATRMAAMDSLERGARIVSSAIRAISDGAPDTGQKELGR